MSCDFPKKISEKNSKKLWNFIKNMISPLAKFRAGERGMHKLLVIITLIILMLPCGSYGKEAGTDLIKVTPAYMTPGAAGNPNSVNTDDPFSAPPPRPRDQMYVFWILGKVLSYPVDTVEQFVTKKIRQVSLKPKTKSQAQPVNPFDSVDIREIPPAPPVLNEASPVNE